MKINNNTVEKFKMVEKAWETSIMNFKKKYKKYKKIHKQFRVIQNVLFYPIYVCPKYFNAYQLIMQLAQQSANIKTLVKSILGPVKFP